MCGGGEGREEGSLRMVFFFPFRSCYCLFESVLGLFMPLFSFAFFMTGALFNAFSLSFLTFCGVVLYDLGVFFTCECGIFPIVA